MESETDEVGRTSVGLAVVMVCVRVLAQSMAEHGVVQIGMSCWKKRESQQPES